MPNIEIADAPKLQAAMSHAAEQVDKAMDRLIPKNEGRENALFEAMRYATLGGGKRVRPFMVLSSAKLFGVNDDSALRTAAAVEFVHCYSLVHDDLPAVDNSDLRRGRASCHKAFDEATAILTGDALLTFAFEILSDPATHDNPAICCRLVNKLASAAGPRGMVAGQILDLMAEKKDFDVGQITRLQRLKTGQLFAFCAEAGAILGQASTQARDAMRSYANDLGLAFQMTDDVIDVEGSSLDTGKPAKQDEAAGKSTFASLLGVERTREHAQMLANQAIAHLGDFDNRADPLRDLARYVVLRRA